MSGTRPCGERSIDWIDFLIEAILEYLRWYDWLTRAKPSSLKRPLRTRYFVRRETKYSSVMIPVENADLDRTAKHN